MQRACGQNLEVYASLIFSLFLYFFSEDPSDDYLWLLDCDQRPHRLYYWYIYIMYIKCSGISIRARSNHLPLCVLRYVVSSSAADDVWTSCYVLLLHYFALLIGLSSQTLEWIAQHFCCSFLFVIWLVKSVLYGGLNWLHVTFWLDWSNDLLI